MPTTEGPLVSDIWTGLRRVLRAVAAGWKRGPWRRSLLLLWLGGTAVGFAMLFQNWALATVYAVAGVMVLAWHDWGLR